MSEAVDLLPWSLTGSVRAQGLYLLTLAGLLLGTVLCLLALLVPRLDVLAVAVGSAGAAGWLLSSGPAEGRTLAVLLPGNGLTVSDLVATPAGLLVLVLVWRRARSRAGVDH